MKRLLIILLVCCTKLSFAQILQPHANFGDGFKRIGVDSTFLIPTFCGVPTLRGFLVPKRGALAFDSCNNRLYVYNPKTAVWDSVKGNTGGGGGTTYTANQPIVITGSVISADTTKSAGKLATFTDVNLNTSQITANTAAIQQRVRYTDTAAMLFPYTLKTKTVADSSTQRQALRDSAAAIRAASAGGGGGGGYVADSISVYNTGSTYTIPNSTNIVYIDPATFTSSLTITLPAVPANKNLISFYFGGTITGGNSVINSLSIVGNTGQVIIDAGALGAVAAGESVIYNYRSSTQKWYRQ